MPSFLNFSSFFAIFFYTIMDASIVPLLTPYNYFEWKSKMIIYLKRHGYYRVTMGLEIELQD